MKNHSYFSYFSVFGALLALITLGPPGNFYAVSRPLPATTGNVSVWVYGPGVGLRLPVAVELVSQAYHRQITLTRSNTSGPGCGSVANTITGVPPGLYDWIATTGQTPPMQGKLTVRAGQCTSQQVTVNGSYNATGSIMFWAKAERGTLLAPAPTIRLTGASPATRYLTATYTTVPLCNAPGGALFANLAPGSYAYVASGGVPPASGTVAVLPGTCVNRALTVAAPGILATGPVLGTAHTGIIGGQPAIGSTTGHTTTSGGSVPISTDSGSTSGGGGTTSGSTSGGTSAGTPPSGTTTSSTTSSTTSGTTTSGGTCGSMNSSLSVVPSGTGFFNNSCSGGVNAYRVTLRNNASVPLHIRISIQKTDGTWNCFLVGTVAPGATAYHSVCGANGNYIYSYMLGSSWLSPCTHGPCQ